MSLFGEVCGVSRKASSNNEPTEVSRSHSSLTLKARGERRRAEPKLHERKFKLPDERRKAENRRKPTPEE